MSFKLDSASLLPPSTAPHFSPAEFNGSLGLDLGSPPLFAGQTFGKLTLLSLLGRGSMGAVWKIKNENLKCERAAKFIHFDPTRKTASVRRWELEKWSLGKLSNPHIVTVHDADIIGDFGVIEMELLTGVSLDKLPGRGLPKPALWTIEAALQICEALDLAHESGIVHRDLKPSNLMLVGGRRGRIPAIKILDFGLTKWIEEDTPANLHTRTGEFVGTPIYASPEQAMGVPIDHRADLYALGVMLYELLTGRQPFGGSLYALLRAHCETVPTPLSALGLDLALPRGLESLVLRCMAKRPEDRPESASLLSEELLTIRDSLTQ